MTAISTEKVKSNKLSIVKALLCLALFVFSLYFGGPIKAGVIEGLRLCAFNIIPTLFPFFILSDLWNSVIEINTNSRIGKIFEKSFGISSDGMPSFLLGNLCGFPLGIKSATEKYDSGNISKSDLEALSVISNNPSAAFAISGVGMGLFSSIKVGVILYFSVLLSAICIGIIFRKKSEKPKNREENARQTFNLVNSVRSAGYCGVVVSSYIIFFSAIISALGSIIKSEVFLSVFSSILEIGSACSLIAEQSKILDIFCLPLISFSLSFSGLSVFLQAFSFLPPFISKRKYLLKKLLQGILSAIFTFFLCLI